MASEQQQKLREDMHSAIKEIIEEFERATGLQVSNLVYGGHGDFKLTVKSAAGEISQI